MLLGLMRFAFHHFIHPRLAAGDVQVLVVGESFFTHRHLAAARPGGVVNLVVCRQAVNHRSPMRIGNHCQVVSFVVQPLAAQGVVTAVVRIQFFLVAGLLFCQHLRLCVSKVQRRYTVSYVTTRHVDPKTLRTRCYSRYPALLMKGNWLRRV